MMEERIDKSGVEPQFVEVEIKTLENPVLNDEICALQDSCRVCMAINNQMVPLFNHEPNGLADKIRFCTGVQITSEDGLPSRICSVCIDNLNIAHKFKSACLLADETFRTLLPIKSNNNVKGSIKHWIDSNSKADLKCDINKHDFNLCSVKIESKNNGYEFEYNNETKFKPKLVNNLCELTFDDNFKRGAQWKCENDFSDNGELHFSQNKNDLVENEPLDITDGMNKKPIIRRRKRGPYKKRILGLNEKATYDDTSTIEMKPPSSRLGKKRGPYKKRINNLPAESELVGNVSGTTNNTTSGNEMKTVKAPIRKLTSAERRKRYDMNRTYICELCGKVCTSRSGLYSHSKFHGPATFHCDHCDYKAIQKHDLIKHIRIHTGSKIYQCEYCPKSFHVSSNLVTHKRNHHEAGRHVCQVCQKPIFIKDFQRHMIAHKGLKKRQCELCLSWFSRSECLTKHMRRTHRILLPRTRPGRKRHYVIETEMQDTMP